jgi:uncharacterized membrane protein
MKRILWSIENKFSNRRFTIQRWLLISCSFSLLLLTFRIILTGRLSYIFLAWNLFLASVPYFISEWFGKHPQIVARKTRLILLLFVWLLFMPNSFYMFTDLFHLDNMDNGNPWFDLTLILSFAWNGLMFGVISIRQMETLLKKTKGKFVSGVVICVVMWLNAFGVYIGRFLRFNSWDIFFNPFSLLTETGNIFFDPYDHRRVWAMSICFAFFMIIVYYTIKKLNEAIKGG